MDSSLVEDLPQLENEDSHSTVKEKETVNKSLNSTVKTFSESHSLNKR